MNSLWKRCFIKITYIWLVFKVQRWEHFCGRQRELWTAIHKQNGWKWWKGSGVNLSRQASQYSWCVRKKSLWMLSVHVLSEALNMWKVSAWFVFLLTNERKENWFCVFHDLQQQVEDGPHFLLKIITGSETLWVWTRNKTAVVTVETPHHMSRPHWTHPFPLF